MKRVLFIVPLPPPVHGSSMISQYIKDSKLINESYRCDYVNLSTSRSVDEIGKPNPVKLWRLFTALLLLICKLTTKRYDLCYLAITCHGEGFLKDAPFALLCKMFGKKIIIHQHNKGMANDVARWPYKWLLHWVYKNTKVILLSWRLYSDIEEIVPKENVYICPNGIPEVKYDYVERNNAVPHLLFLSNLIESKGVIVLLDALMILKNKGYSLVCFFVGSETKEIDYVRFEKEVNERGLNNMAFYRGKKLGKDKGKYFSEADIFVFPTFYQNETFGLVNLEAMAHCLPIVTTDEGGIPDIVKDGENGLICEKNNPESLANCIKRLLDDERLRIEMGEKGYNKYKQEYTIHNFEKRIVQILCNNLG